MGNAFGFYHNYLTENIYLIISDGGIRKNVMINASFLPNTILYDWKFKQNQAYLKGKK
jgi:hypothetical protein